MIPWKIAWVVLGGAATLAAGVVPALLEVPAYAVIPAAALTGVLIALGLTNLVRMVDMFRSLPDSSQVFISRCLVFAVFLHAAWVAALALSPSWLPWWWLGVLTLSLAEWGWCEAHEYILTHRPEKPEVPTTADGRALDDVETDMAVALELAGHRRVTVQDWDPVVDEDGTSIGTVFRVQLPVTRTVPSARAQGGSSR
jgi:hypothetical protein